MTAAPIPESAAAAKTKQKRGEPKPLPGNARKSSRISGAATQSNTLDMWFKKAPPKSAAAAKEKGETDKDADEKAAKGAVDHSDSSSSEQLEVLNVDPPLKKKKVTATSDTSRKLVQRRIHINDPCRVCGNARTEESSRCELRCLGCDMTVHTKCYDIHSDEPIDDWNCRRCQYVVDTKEELKSGGIDPVVDDDISLLPAHEGLQQTHKFHELHGNSDFATVFQFLKRFRRMGLKISSDATLNNLADALTNPQHNIKFIEELHLRLLANVEATISKNHGWTVSLARFLKETAHHPTSEKLDAFLAASTETSRSKKDKHLTPTLSALTKELYVDELSVSERVAILKFVCEAQFDENEALVERIGDQEGDSLREEPVGTDASGRTYWVLEDPPSVLDGTAWVCRCAKQDGSDWETVTDDLETLESLLTWLSLSSETLELQLWQTFSGGILKSLTRRYKKKQQSEQRMARMPRLLGTTGLDLASMVSVDDDGFGVRRSMRSRRAVNYRIEESEDEGENASDDSDEEERDEDEEINGDGGDDDDEEMRPSKRQRRSLQLSKRVEGEPSRRSSRLRGGGVDRNKHDDDVSAQPPSPRRHRRVAAVAAASVASSSKRCRRGALSSSSSSEPEINSDAEEEEEEEEDDDVEEAEAE